MKHCEEEGQRNKPTQEGFDGNLGKGREGIQTGMKVFRTQKATRPK